MTSRAANSWFQTTERYFNAIRKISFIDPKIISFFNDDIKYITNQIESFLSDMENNKKDYNFELRNLIFRLEDILDVKVIQKYNELLSSDVVVEKMLKEEKVAKVEPAKAEINTSSDKAKTPKEVWTDVLSYLKDKLNVHTYNVWVKPITYDSCEKDNIKISVQNYFYKNWLEEHCSSLIKEHLESIQSNYKVTFIAN